MREFVSILTSLIFAAHAALGCCAHHAHGHELGSAGHQAACIDRHDGHAGQQHDDAPVDGDEHSGDACDHPSCVFVKAKLLNVDLADGNSLCWPGCLSNAANVPVEFAAAIFSRIASVDGRATELYVWHCALLI